MEAVPLTDDQKKLLKLMVAKHGLSGKVLPYTEGFEGARKDFTKQSGLELSEHDFWKAVSGAGSKRRPPARKPAKVAKEADDDEEGE